LGRATVGDFWSWAYSDILSNTTRGIFAEFVVGTALGVVGGVRDAWANFDLLYEGSGIEVKSAAYVQSWNLPEHNWTSPISWDIKERFPYDPVTDRRGDVRVRSADCYVFCLYNERLRKGADVLDLDKWEFYVLATERINRELGSQQKVGLGRIRAMTDSVDYARLKEQVDRALSTH